MCGTDYNDNIPRIGSKTAYKHIKNYRSIENFSEETSTDISILKQDRVRELFTVFEDYNITTIPFCGHPNFEELEYFIKKHKIYTNLEKIKNDFTLKIIVFDD